MISPKATTSVRVSSRVLDTSTYRAKIEQDYAELARLRHSVSFDENGQLSIAREGKTVAVLSGLSGWNGLPELMDRFGILRALDVLNRDEKWKSTPPTQDIYIEVVDKWVKAAERRRLKRNEESKKALLWQGKTGVQSRQMPRRSLKINIIGVENSDTLSMLLEEISVALSNGHKDQSTNARFKKLEDRLRVVLEAAKTSIPSQANIHLPNTAPESYIPRQSGRASEFLKLHWGPYIEAGICFRPDIKRLDPKLEMALANEFRGRTDELRAILPTKTDEVDSRIERELGGPVRPEKRSAAQSALRFAKAAKR